MEVKEYIKYYDSIIPTKKLQNLLLWLNHAHEKGKFFDAKVGDGKGRTNKNIRDCLTYFFATDGDSITAAHWTSYLKHLFNRALWVYNEDTKLSPNSTEFLTHVSELSAIRYENNNFYKYHADDNQTSLRRLSGIYFPNDDYEGGEVSFIDKKGEFLRIKPRQNRIVIFPSNFMFHHAVLPVQKGLRWTLVMWAN